MDIVVEYGDFEKIKELASDVTNGRTTGKVVQIDGEVINFDKTMSFGIGEANAQGNERRGVTFVIVGLSTDEYPADRTHIKLTGIIASDGENPGFRIYTLPEFVEVVEE